MFDHLRNKKGKVEEGAKKRTRKAQKFQKAIVGNSANGRTRKTRMNGMLVGGRVPLSHRAPSIRVRMWDLNL